LHLGTFIFLSKFANQLICFTHANYETEIMGENERKLHYLYSSGCVVAVYEMKNSVGAVYYVHKDHLGSGQVVTNQAGQVVQEQSFDAWGRRRNPVDWSYFQVNPIQKFHRGYTGYEQLDQFGLINMTGRMYDPATARFLSPDISFKKISTFTVDIQSIDGRILKSIDYQENDVASISQDVSFLKPGLYLFSIKTSDTVFVKKVIIQ
jgi:RHS repeat-associated protein